ncbi:MAG: hypothetical protein V1899_06850 [Planctomycetota bacterium]
MVKHSSAIIARLTLCFFMLCICGCEERTSVDPRERAELQRIFDEARKLDELGRYHEALVRYETILARRPEYISTRLNAAMSAYDSGQYQKANDHFEILHKFGPGDWFVIRKLIQCNERLGKSEVVDAYRKKLEALRQQKDGSLVLKRYEGLTRDFIPVGSMHLIGYEFFEPKKHGRLWHFKLEDKNKKNVSAFLVQATPYHDNSGKRMFSLTEVSFGWLRVWHVGPESRDYKWSRDFVLESLQRKRSPLVTRPLPHEYEALAMPTASGSSDKDPIEKQPGAEDTERP